MAVAAAGAGAGAAAVVSDMGHPQPKHYKTRASLVENLPSGNG